MIMSKKLEKTISSQNVCQEQQNPQSQMDDEMMLQQSMAALQQQEEMEKDAYLRGDTSALYSADSYQMQNQAGTGEFLMTETEVESELPDVEPMVTEQQQGDTPNKYTNIFASIFNKLATVFGENSAIGSKLKEMADGLQETYGQDAEQVQEEAMQERMARGEHTEADTSGKSLSDTQHTSDVSWGDQSPYTPSDDTKLEWQRQEEISNRNMENSANRLLEQDEFVSMAKAKDKDFDRMNSSMNTMGRHLGEDTMVRLSAADAGSKEKAEVSHNYMTMMRGLKVYNDTALSGIEEKYADDPEKLEQAKQGLSNVMSRATGKAYGIVAGDNRTYDFLSEEDIQELDSMQLQGVDKTYSQYVAEHQLQPQGQEDMSVYANAFETSSHLSGKMESVVEPNATSVARGNTGVQSVYSRMTERQMGTQTSMPKTSVSNRGAQAENAFSTVLQNEQAAKQSSLTDGLER